MTQLALREPFQWLQWPALQPAGGDRQDGLAQDHERRQGGLLLHRRPLVIDGKVIVGDSGGAFGIVGTVTAYDAETGEDVWCRPVLEAIGAG
ncbi:MAG: hypothetical protein R3F54_03550 [Alphaproteobacteria bacterium]